MIYAINCVLCWFEAVSGSLIGSKSLNRSVEIFGTLLVSSYQFRD